MALSNSPIRIDEDIHEAARAVAPLMSRSASQQVSHWARIGREIESSPSTSVRDIERVLSGEAHYDDLGTHEQAIVRSEWSERMRGQLRALNFAEQFEAEGRPYVELDDNGDVVRREPLRPDATAEA